mmetsp:Transcript_13134/g.37490  ORF Transcript_13134/g.37490 Transcript_13134/m.37490 type:complete len:261 (-) Transcript_13134:1632-2414(-)
MQLKMLSSSKHPSRTHWWNFTVPGTGVRESISFKPSFNSGMPDKQQLTCKAPCTSDFKMEPSAPTCKLSSSLTSRKTSFFSCLTPSERHDTALVTALGAKQARLVLPNHLQDTASCDVFVGAVTATGAVAPRAAADTAWGAEGTSPHSTPSLSTATKAVLLHRMENSRESRVAAAGLGEPARSASPSSRSRMRARAAMRCTRPCSPLIGAAANWTFKVNLPAGVSPVSSTFPTGYVPSGYNAKAQKWLPANIAGAFFGAC